jgi:peptidoglycan/xylan/chitin deacetylase (PgdA/CDA1 family)
MGHLIGNHTYNHIDLAGKTAKVAAKEIIRADGVISGVPRTLKLFRPPFGNWDSEVAGQLNWTKVWPYIGPVLWDIEAKDWRWWRDEKSAVYCAAAYIGLIQRVGKGVILMHDGSEVRFKSYTFQAAQRIVDWLERNDYKFVGLDSVPQIAHAARISSVIGLQATTGHYISPPQGGGGQGVSRCARYRRLGAAWSR